MSERKTTKYYLRLQVEKLEAENAALRERAEDAKIDLEYEDYRMEMARERIRELEGRLDATERQRDQYRAALEAAGVEI